MNTMLKFRVLFSCRLSIFVGVEAGMGIKNLSVSWQMHITHQKCWVRKMMMQSTYLMQCCAERLYKYTPALQELSKRVDGDKCKDLIYLVDKRINCCYLPKARTGCRGSCFCCSMLGEDFLEEVGPGEFWLMKGEDCAKTCHREVQAWEMEEVIILPSLGCLATETHTKWWQLVEATFYLHPWTILINPQRTQKQTHYMHLSLSHLIFLPFPIRVTHGRQLLSPSALGSKPRRRIKMHKEEKTIKSKSQSPIIHLMVRLSQWFHVSARGQLRSHVIPRSDASSAALQTLANVKVPSVNPGVEE